MTRKIYIRDAATRSMVGAVLPEDAGQVFLGDGTFGAVEGGGPHTHTEADVTGLVDDLAAAQAAAEATAAAALSAHTAAADPHTGYQRETEKAAANGYASLDGTGKVPSAQLPGPATVVISQTEVDFGADAVDGSTFIVADAAVLLTSKIIGGVAYAAPTSKDISELDGEGLDLKFGVQALGQMWIRARGLDGMRCYGKWKINYLVG